MHYRTILPVFIAIAVLLSAGCTQLPGSGTAPAAVPETTARQTAAAAPEPAPPAATATVTGTPGEVATIIRHISQIKDVRDSELLFALQVPVEWMPGTYRLENPDNTEGLAYRTDLLADNAFSIYTYAISRSQDQAYRDLFRKWQPAPSETTVTINGITYDRFESESGGLARIAYVARKSSANERGYASVLVFTADTADLFEKEDYEKVVSSFRYFPAGSAGSEPGTEIPRSAATMDSSGSVQSNRGSSGDSGSGSSSGSSSGGCSRCSGG